MMTRQILAGVLLAAAMICVCLGGSPADSDPAQSCTQDKNMVWTFGEHGFSYSLTVDQFKDTPGWADPSGEQPPLSIGQAIDTSRQELPRYVPEVSTWVLESVELIRFDDNTDRWFYLVTWQPEGASVDHQMHIPVLMNGIAARLKQRDSARPKVK